MGSETATQLHKELVEEWSKGEGAREDRVKALLAMLKIELSGLGLLFPSVDPTQSLDVGALTTARDILEIGAFQAIRSQDVPAFERYLNLLGPYYNDLAATLPRSINEAALLALSLLRLLSQNRIAEFHTLLETLTKEVVDSTEVNWVIALERSLMEGSYSRVWRLCRPSTSAASQLPRPEFAYFVSTLVGTVRNEIASCDERAYATLPLLDAKTLLFFDTEDEVRAFAKERGWYIDAQAIVHFASSARHPSNTAAGKAGIPRGLNSGIAGSDKELDKERVVAAALGYAKELESIV